ncbi:SRPBCC domain-containing protein [Domibacillus iocasae]|uniref:ATPase n=1 Tax=Domibacillus iocasae TaxID=1714016 RepID=A0A1E7DTI6_9BACI|nr:SRPBCC domain-containing protein [Domibacillus iocasae]OES45998.1 ATPase [Domibacillus iocasae]
MTTQSNSLTSHTDGKVLVVERTFNATRELVFKAFSESERLEKWWGPQGWETKNLQFEFKTNGVWHYCMTCVDKEQGDFYGQKSCGKGIYHEIVEPEKIVYTDLFVDDQGNAVQDMPELLITMNFVEQEGKTMVITRTEFASEEALQQVVGMGVVEGVSSQYERLDALLEEQLA